MSNAKKPPPVATAQTEGKKGVAPQKTCPKCKSKVLARAKTCECGHDFKAMPRPKSKSHKTCPHCKVTDVFLTAPFCQNCGYDFKKQRVVKPRMAIQDEFDDDDLPPLDVQPATKTKPCPNCKHICFHLAPFCEKCEWNFKTNSPKEVIKEKKKDKDEATEEQQRIWFKESQREEDERRRKEKSLGLIRDRKVFSETAIGQVVRLMEVADSGNVDEWTGWLDSVTNPANEDPLRKFQLPFLKSLSGSDTVMVQAYTLFRLAHAATAFLKERMKSFLDAKETVKHFGLKWNVDFEEHLIEYEKRFSDLIPIPKVCRPGHLQEKLKALELIVSKICKEAVRTKKKAMMFFRKLHADGKERVRVVFTQVFGKSTATGWEGGASGRPIWCFGDGSYATSGVEGHPWDAFMEANDLPEPVRQMA